MAKKIASDLAESQQGDLIGLLEELRRDLRKELNLEEGL